MIFSYALLSGGLLLYLRLYGLFYMLWGQRLTYNIKIYCISDPEGYLYIVHKEKVPTLTILYYAASMTLVKSA